MHRPLLVSLLLSGACGGAHHQSTPDYSPVAAVAAPTQAALYTACLADAIASGQVQANPERTMLLFTCTGEPAHAFFDGLADRASRVGSEFQHAGRIVRTTNPVEHDMHGVDACSTDAAQAEFACTLSFNAGAFLREP